MNETFQNLPVSIDALPSLTPTDFQPIEKAYRKVSIISSCIFFTVLMVAGISIIYFNDFGNKPLGYGTAGGSVGLLWICNLIFIVKAFP